MQPEDRIKCRPLYKVHVSVRSASQRMNGIMETLETGIADLQFVD